jgi:flagellar motility protein MotE (MotC chaperone)
MNISNPRYLLPLMIFFGVLTVGVRVGDLWDAASSGRMFTPTAMAETKPDAAAKTDAPPADAAKPASDSSAAAPSDDGDVSPAEMEVLKQLSDRRDQLDKRAKELDSREALIKVAEQRVDQKIKEMETLRVQLQSMVNQGSEAQAAQIENLVKIYETMKPDDAARIFEQLDMPVLLGVIQKMKPARTAPILAKMAPEKAKEITTALTKRDQLPQIK